MISWKAIVTGFILAMVLSLFFGAAGGGIGFYLSMLIAGIAVGYTVNVNLKNGATHGAITGLITGLIIMVLSILTALSVGAGQMLLGLVILVQLILSIIIWILLGAIGGIIGTIITERLWKTVFRKGNVTEVTETENPGTKSGVKFTGRNISKCLCSQCPVQAESECAQTKMKLLQESMRGMSPEPSDISGMYCATGIATCDDINPNRMCNCPQCEVFKENSLTNREHGAYFCQNGAAK